MSIITRIKKLRHDIYRWEFRRRPIQTNKVLLWADSFKHFGCSPKYIALYLLKEYPGKFDLVWVFDSGASIPKDFPKEIRVVRYFSIEYLKEIATAKFIICNMRTNDSYFFDKRIGQIYIQTWHSSLRLKKIEGDARQFLGDRYVEVAQNDSKKIDMLISGCDFSTDIFKRAFWYDGFILKSGTPRCDILVNGPAEIKRKVFRIFKIPQDKKLVLYAPTFRKDKKADVYGMDFKKLATAMETYKGGNWVFGCRLHPNILEDFADEHCISMTGYSDMQELIVAADILITDYSSCMFDMAIAKKKCILYTPDIEEYLTQERGIYFDVRELPFPIAEDMEMLCDKIINFDTEKYKCDLQSFMNRIGSYETGVASKQVADYMINKMN